MRKCSDSSLTAPTPFGLFTMPKSLPSLKVLSFGTIVSDRDFGAEMAWCTNFLVGLLRSPAPKLKTWMMVFYVEVPLNILDYFGDPTDIIAWEGLCSAINKRLPNLDRFMIRFSTGSSFGGLLEQDMEIFIHSSISNSPACMCIDWGELSHSRLSVSSQPLISK